MGEKGRGRKKFPDQYQQILLKLSEKEDMKRHLLLNFLIQKRKQGKHRYGWIIHLVVDILQTKFI
jgi:hypothetical protein